MLATVVIAYACGSENAAKKDAGHDSTMGDAAHDAGFDAHFDAPPLGSGGTMFTVKNYAEWCSVQIGSGTATTADIQHVSVAPGAHVLTAKAAGSAYQLGSNMWHDTDGDVGSGSGSGSGSGFGSGEPGTQTGSGSAAQSVISVMIGSAARCVWVCCPLTGGTGCPVTDQCP